MKNIFYVLLITFSFNNLVIAQSVLPPPDITCAPGDNCLAVTAPIIVGALNPSATVPEPSVLALLALGIVGLGLARRKNNKNK